MIPHMTDDMLPLRALTFTYGYDPLGAAEMKVEWGGEENIVIDAGIISFVEKYAQEYSATAFTFIDEDD